MLEDLREDEFLINTGLLCCAERHGGDITNTRALFLQKTIDWFVKLGVLGFYVTYFLTMFFHDWRRSETFLSSTSMNLSFKTRMAGVFMLLLYLPLFFWIFLHLGLSWSNLGIRSKQKLVTSGPYQYVRHPMYSFSIFLGVIGQILAFSDWIFVIISSILTLLVFAKASHEEILLQQHFGGEYIKYQKRTGMFLPKF